MSAEKIPAEIMAEAREVYRAAVDAALYHYADAHIVLAKALLARDTAARKECAEIARTCLLKLPLAPGFPDGAAMTGEQIATAIEATIGGRDG